MKRKLRDIRDTGCINMHKAKARSSGAPKHEGMELVTITEVLMCVFSRQGWGKEGKSPVPVSLPRLSSTGISPSPKLGS